MAIKSALMTSAVDVLDTRSQAARIFRQGAGHVLPNEAAIGPRLRQSLNDWLAFLCGTTTGGQPGTHAQGRGFGLDASDMNVPSIAIGDLAGIQTVKRRVTNVGAGGDVHRLSGRGRRGSTRSFHRRPSDAQPGVRPRHVRGDVHHDDGDAERLCRRAAHVVGRHAQRPQPIVIRPVALAARRRCRAGAAQPKSTASMTFGYDGAFATRRELDSGGDQRGPHGQRRPDRLDVLPELAERAEVHEVVYRQGRRARGSRCSTFTDGADDLDLCVFLGDFHWLELRQQDIG